VVDLPCKVLGVEESGVHALASLGRVCVTAVASHEDALVQGVSLCDTLSYGVNGVPLDTLPLDGVWLEDLLCVFLDLLGGGLLPRIPIGVGRRCDLDVQADHVVLAGNDHDGSNIGVNCAFHLFASLVLRLTKHVSAISSP